MMCEFCKGAGDNLSAYRATKTTGTAKRLIREHIESLHDKCKGPHQCTCQHKLEKYTI